MNFKKFFLGLVAFHLIFIISYAMNQKSAEYYRKTHPHVKIRSRNIVIDFFIPRVRGCGNPIYKERSRLKQLGTTVAMYFSDGTTSKYPSNPKQLDLEPDILNTRKGDNSLQLPQDWQIPNNWQDFNNSHSAYAFLKTPEEKYTGSNLTPVFIIKPNYHYNPNCRQVVFEDGHVECLPEEEAIRLWEKVGMWNNKEN